MTWRYYAQRATSGLWLDTNCQLDEVELSWQLSAPGHAKAIVPFGLGITPYAEDGRLTWGKYDTLLYAEEDGSLEWAGFCTSADPDTKGLALEFAGTSGWLQGVDFDGVYRRWQPNVFDVVRMLIAHAHSKPRRIEHIVSQNDSLFWVGDQEPPAKPKQPPRRKGEKVSDYHSSKRYQKWQDDISEWNSQYADRKPYEVAWWDSPYVGEEIDSLAKEVGFDYRERYRWKDRGALVPAFHIDLSDNMVNRRTDVAFVDGVNVGRALDPKHGSHDYANRVIGLGAGEGRKMVKEERGADDGRLYRAEFVQYKSIRDHKRLGRLVEADLTSLKGKDPDLDFITVWDVDGYARINTLQVGDEVNISSQNLSPPLNVWRKITKIIRKPEETTTDLYLERA